MFAYQISETDCYLPVPSIPGAGNTISVADPAVITNFQLQPKFSPGSHVPTFSGLLLSKAYFLPVILSYYTTKSVKAFRRYRHLKLPTHTFPAKNSAVAAETTEILRENEFGFHRL